MAAVDIFLAIDGIPGESTDARHRGEIEVSSFSWGVSQAPSATGRAAGKPSFTELVVTSPVSRASPEFWLACASGRHLASAVLTCRNPSQQHEFLALRLQDVVVASYQSSGTDEQRPLDQIALAFGRIDVSYTGQDATGRSEPAVTTGWDLRKNVKA